MTIRMGVAGVAHPHINAIIAEAGERPDVTIAGIAERDDRLRAEYTERYGAAGFTDHTQLLDAGGIDMVAVGAVFGERGQVVTDALEAGVHVLADKPMCTSRTDLAAIQRAWQASLGRVRETLLQTDTGGLEPRRRRRDR